MKNVVLNRVPSMNYSDTAANLGQKEQQVGSFLQTPVIRVGFIERYAQHAVTWLQQGRGLVRSRVCLSCIILQLLLYYISNHFCCCASQLHNF